MMTKLELTLFASFNAFGTELLQLTILRNQQREKL